MGEPQTTTDDRGVTNDQSDTARAREVAEETKGQAQEVAGAAAEKGREMAGTAAEKGRDVAETAKAEIGHVAQEAADQARNVVGDAKRQLKDQAQSQTENIAEALRRLEQQTRALLDGRADEAGAIKDYARQAADQIGRLAERTQTRGLEGLTQELQAFGRDRPGPFLAGAAAAGFALARLMRSGAMNQSPQAGDRPTGAVGNRPGMGGSTAGPGTHPTGG